MFEEEEEVRAGGSGPFLILELGRGWKTELDDQGTQV